MHTNTPIQQELLLPDGCHNEHNNIHLLVAALVDPTVKTESPT
jgi:hypothetical protein